MLLVATPTRFPPVSCHDAATSVDELPSPAYPVFKPPRRMNYGHVILPKQHVIYQVFEGSFTAEQLIACVRRLWNDPAYSKHYHGIADISRMVGGTSLERLVEIVIFLKDQPQLSQGRWAVITSTPIVTAAAMVYKREMAARHPFGVFSTWESACAFLQLDMPVRPAPTFFPDLTHPAPVV